MKYEYTDPLFLNKTKQTNILDRKELIYDFQNDY